MNGSEKMVTPYKKLTRRFNGKLYRFGSYHESKKSLNRYIEDMPNFNVVFNLGVLITF